MIIEFTTRTHCGIANDPHTEVGNQTIQWHFLYLLIDLIKVEPVVRLLLWYQFDALGIIAYVIIASVIVICADLHIILIVIALIRIWFTLALNESNIDPLLTFSWASSGSHSFVIIVIIEIPMAALAEPIVLRHFY